MSTVSSTSSSPDPGARRGAVAACIDGVEYRFTRLSWRARNRAVHRGVDVDVDGVELRPMSFGQALLRASLDSFMREGQVQPVTDAWLAELPVALSDQLIEAAVGVNRRRVVPVEEGATCARGTTVFVQGVAYCLAPWSWGTRNRLLADAVRGGPGIGSASSPEIDPARLHERALAVTCVSVDGRAPAPTWLDELDADVGDALLEYLLAGGELEPEDAHELVAAVRAGRDHDGITLYTLCRDFGWTPAQVRAQRAIDVDVLMCVHRAMGERGPAPPGRAAPTYGDANSGNETVILISQDPA
ncbi:hypothetical protein [Haliangium sp.]|uniref:hypothetical protein n=1 Tax=Haliangium sp. TaxID=2663208 RepID=UPI003D0E9022